MSEYGHIVTARKRDRSRTPASSICLSILILLFACLPCGVASHAAGETGSGHWMTGAPAPTARIEVAVAVLDGMIDVVGGFERPGGSYSRVNEIFIPPVPSRSMKSGRTPAAHIGSVMAILATFHEAGVLPPESSAEADRLIHALIQSQSMFLKSSDPAVRNIFASALAEKFNAKKAASLTQAFALTGWTSETLEALVDYSAQRTPADEPRLAEAFHDYNVSTTDWKFVEQVFRQARERLLKQGKQVHAVFAAQRSSMPGARRSLP